MDPSGSSSLQQRPNSEPLSRGPALPSMVDCRFCLPAGDARGVEGAIAPHLVSPAAFAVNNRVQCRPSDLQGLGPPAADGALWALTRPLTASHDAFCRAFLPFFIISLILSPCLSRLSNCCEVHAAVMPGPPLLVRLPLT